jgi:raw score 2.95
MIYRIRVFCFDIKYRQNLVLESLDYVKEKNIKLISIKKRWENGFHIEYILESRFLKELKGYLYDQLTNIPDIPKKVFDKMLHQIRLLKDIENAPAESKKVKENKQIVIESVGTNLSNIYDNESYLEIQKIKQNWIKDFTGEIFESNKEQKNSILLKMMLIAANKFHFDDDYKGFKFGVLSYYSHYQGYINHIEQFPPLYKQKYKDMIFHGVSTTKKSLKDLDDWLTELSKQSLNEDILINWSKMLDQLMEKHRDLVDKKKIYSGNDYEIEQYLDKMNNVSNFHKKFTLNKNFKWFVSSKEFKVYRGTINQMYEVLTFLSISSLQRTIYCGGISEYIFESYKFDIDELLKDINEKYGY